MALTFAGRQLTEAHRLLQVRLAGQTGALMLQSWSLLDPEDLDGTAEDWLATATAVVQGQRARSAATAATYLQTLRVVELGEPFNPIVVGPAPHAKLATALLVTGPIGLKANMARMMPLAKATDLALSAVAGAAIRLALEGGRDTLRATSVADPRATGWQRVTSGNACAFCEDLADIVFTSADADFEAHDRCTCSAVLTYD